MIELIRTEINAHEQALTPHRLSVASMCRLLNVTRAAVYRPHHGQVATQIAVAESADVRREIMEVATQMPCYGYRRIVEEVSRRRSKRVNHKQVRRVMHAENLVCRRPKRFRVTTDSRHGFAVYPNLAGEMNLTGINQLWVADITYVRLPKGFCYLAAILDAFSRRVVGWSLESYLGGINNRRVVDGTADARRQRSIGSSFRSGRPVCLLRVHQLAQRTQHPNQHVAVRQSV